MLRPLISALAVAVALLLSAGAAFAGTTSAGTTYSAPDVAAARLIDQVHVGEQNPHTGSTLPVSGTSCMPNSSVSISLDGGAYPLGSAATDGAGNYNTLVRLPKGLSGSHTLSVAGSDCADTGGVIIQALAPAVGRAAGSNPAQIRVAVVGISALGVVLLVGGGLMLLAGARRRRPHHV